MYHNQCIIGDEGWHAADRGDTLQHTATLQHVCCRVAVCCVIDVWFVVKVDALLTAAALWNTLQPCNALAHADTHCNMLQQAACRGRHKYTHAQINTNWNWAIRQDGRIAKRWSYKFTDRNTKRCPKNWSWFVYCIVFTCDVLCQCRSTSWSEKQIRTAMVK